MIRRKSKYRCWLVLATLVSAHVSTLEVLGLNHPLALRREPSAGK